MHKVLVPWYKIYYYVIERGTRYLNIPSVRNTFGIVKIFEKKIAWHWHQNWNNRLNLIAISDYSSKTVLKTRGRRPPG